MLASQNPLSLTDRPHQLFADAPPMLAPPLNIANPPPMAAPPLMSKFGFVQNKLKVIPLVDVPPPMGFPPPPMGMRPPPPPPVMGNIIPPPPSKLVVLYCLA